MMNITQRAFLAVFLPLTLVLLALELIYPENDLVAYFRFAIVLALFLAVLGLKKEGREKKRLALAFAFLTLGDFFFVFCSTLDNLPLDLFPFGILSFILAYACLTAALARQARFGQAIRTSRRDLLAAVLILGSFTMVALAVWPYVGGILLIGTLIFGLVVCVMAWTAIHAMQAGFFSRKAAVRMAVAASLMFISDMAVAFDKFHPLFAQYVPWLEVFIVITYLPAWTLLAVAISDQDFLAGQKKDSGAPLPESFI